jgi:hypothetical protein
MQTFDRVDQLGFSIAWHFQHVRAGFWPAPIIFLQFAGGFTASLSLDSIASHA